MAYRITHRKADGTTERTHVGNDGSRCIITRDSDRGATGLVVKDGKGKRKVNYNFSRFEGGVHLSGLEREAQLRRHLQDLRSEHRQTRGMSRGGTMKHLASIPPELYWKALAEDSEEAMQDRKYVMKLAKKWGVTV